MAEARQLIAEKNYNEAIVILIKVVAEEPDRMDEAQELINEVARLRNQYNADYEKVLDLLYQKDDVESALKLIAQIEAVDKNPNKQMAEDVRQMKRGARIKLDNKRYADIRARALALLDQREYGRAIQVYLEGEDLAREAFLEEEYGNVFYNQVTRAWQDLRSASTLVVQAEARLKAIPDQGLTVLASATAPAALEPMLSPLRDLAAWRQRVWSDGRQFATQNRLLEDNGRQADPHLQYAQLLLHGPEESERPEGILGAIDRLWSESLDPWTAKVRSDVEAQYAQAKAAFDQGRYPAAQAAFESLRVKTRLGMEVVTLWNRLAGVDAAGKLDADFRGRLTQVLPLGLWLEHRLVLANQGVAASTELPRAAGLAATPTLDRAALEAARSDVRNQKQRYASNALTVADWIRQSQLLAAQGINALDSGTFVNAWQASWSDLRQKALVQEAAFVERRGALDYSALDGRFQSLQTTLTRAREQVEGAVKYPSQAITSLTNLRPDQDALARDIGSFVGLYDGEATDVRTPAVQAWPNRGRELLGRLTQAQTLQGQLLVVAQTNYARSQGLKREGQDLVASVNAATAAENFVKAKADLNTISTRFADSLRLQEDPQFRAESDALVQSLGDLILRRENEVVVREVRALITQGSEAYQDGQFRQSEQILLRAQKRWADTNKDPNPEVKYWLDLTSLALSVQTGRELLPIDPLYNEVQQLLNFARRDFTLGKEQLDAGNQQAGQALMDQATATLRKILLTAPQNQEAGLLKLEILKASDPDNFPALYKRSFDAAVERLAGNDVAALRTAYTDLLDLQKLQAEYPGMDAAIKQFRLKLGIDKPAVDVQALNQARTLVAQATRLFEGGSAAQLADAQTRVQRALVLDPKNRAAQELSDRISLRITNFVAALTPSQRGELNDMVDLIRTQRNLEALARITEFKAKYPAVVNDPFVREVERRIKAVN